jgi:hypothetical protein
VLRDRVVRFRLDDGRHIDRDFSLVEGGVFTETWSDPRKFGKVFVAGGCPSWPGELDFCPDVILGTEGRVPKFAFVGRGVLISQEVVATAFHEAGHAVVGHQLTGEAPRKISVIPEDGSVGRTCNHPWPRSFKPLVRMTPLSRQRLEDETVKILSGFEAERRHTGRADHHGAGEDFKGARVYARLVVGDDAEGVAAYIEWCSYLARRAVERNWDRIGRFARRLADAGELEGRELKKALTSASWDGPACSRWQA